MDFFDKTLSILLIACSTVYLVEWILGPIWIDKSKDKLILWWMNFDDFSLSKIVPTPIFFGKYVLNKLFNISIEIYYLLYIKYYYISIPSQVFMVLFIIKNECLVFFIRYEFTDYIIDTVKVIENNSIVIIFMLFVLLVLTICSIILFLVLFIGVLIYIITVSNGIFFLSVFLTINIIRLSLITPLAIVTFFFMFLDVVISELCFNIAQHIVQSAIGELNIYGFIRWAFLTFIFFLIYTPTLVHLLISITFFILLFIDKFAQPVMTMLLLRLSESEKGILTQIGLLIGFMVAAGKEVVKLLS
jgi:hypothetical protein